jgi:YfiH family protein
MINAPFALFSRFPGLTVNLYIKTDDVRGDPGERTVGLNQKHGNRTIVVREPRKRTDEADGMITDQKNLALCLRAADCQNFVMYAPSKNAAGALHVGWRGLLAGAIPEFLKAMTNDWHMSTDELLIAAGPSLCMKCADFTDPARELPSIPNKFISGKHVDLRGASLKQWMDAGIAASHIEYHPDCTRCHPELYWTYRGGDREEVLKGHTNMLVASLK